MKTLLIRTAACSTLLLVAIACDDDPSDGDDTDAGTDADTDSDSDSDSDTDSDTDTDTDPDYPPGPYGFTPSMAWGATSGAWTDDGDTIPDICLNDVDEEEICLGDWYRDPSIELICLDFCAMWCGPCNDAADGARDFVDHLAANGWTAVWNTIMEQDYNQNPPDAADLSTWLNNHSLDDDLFLLYDGDNEWLDDAIASGFPSVYLLHTSNMLIWNLTEGWADPDDEAGWDEFKDWFAGGPQPFLDYCASQPGAIAP